MKYTELSEVAKRHKDWVALVESFGERDIAEDIVQDMYLKIEPKEEVNDGYIYLTLRSITLNHFKDNNKMRKIDLDNCIELRQHNDIEEQEAFGRILQKINEEMCSWDDYDEQLFRVYFHTEWSLRTTAKKLNMTVRHVYFTIKKCKERLEQNVCEDWQDYVNKDYELI